LAESVLLPDFARLLRQLLSLLLQLLLLLALLVGLLAFALLVQPQLLQLALELVFVLAAHAQRLQFFRLEQQQLGAGDVVLVEAGRVVVQPQDNQPLAHLLTTPTRSDAIHNNLVTLRMRRTLTGELFSTAHAPWNSNK